MDIHLSEDPEGSISGTRSDRDLRLLALNEQFIEGMKVSAQLMQVSKGLDLETFNRASDYAKVLMERSSALALILNKKFNPNPPIKEDSSE